MTRITLCLAFLVGCAVSPPPESTVESDITTTCCSTGSVWCPANGFELDYDPPGCGPLTHPTAQRICAAQCGQACVDSGWIYTC